MNGGGGLQGFFHEKLITVLLEVYVKVMNLGIKFSLRFVEFKNLYM